MLLNALYFHAFVARGFIVFERNEYGVQREIWIVDEKEYFRKGLKNLVELYYPGNNVVEMDFESFKKAYHAYRDNYPNLIIMTPINENENTYFLEKAKQQGTKLVLMAQQTKEIFYFRSLELYDGFLLKNMTTKQLINVLKSIVNDNDVYVHPDIGYELLRKIYRR